MNIPKDIQTKMHKAASYFSKGKDLMKDVDEYFISCGLDIDELRCGNGCSLEEIEYGNDITNKFVEEATNDFSSGLWNI